MSDLFNSSDVISADDAPVKLRAHLGEKSIGKIIENAADDRLTSKKVVKNLSFGHGAVGSRAIQSLWVNRFEAFRLHTLKKSLDTPFTGDDLIRFCTTMIGQLEVKDRGKPALSQNTIIHAVKVLISYGHFRWSREQGFKIDRHDSIRFRTLIDDAVEKKKLVRGTWNRRSWVGFATLSRLVRAWFKHQLQPGPNRSMDVTISRALSVVLVAALGARAGDVALTRGYVEEFMHYRHINLYLVGNSPTPALTDLRAEVTIEFAKGSKNIMNENVVRYLRPLDGEHLTHCCPIALLLTHALRHGLVAGTTLQEVLDRAAARSDRCVVWTSPQLPVLVGFKQQSGTFCVLDRPAHAGQLTSTIKVMGLVAGIVGTRIYAHALRNGASREVAHLPASGLDGAGVATEAVRQTLGHSVQTFESGLTEKYVGGSTAETWNLRVDQANRLHQREPTFAAAPEPADDAGGDASVYSQINARCTVEEMVAVLGPGVELNRTNKKRARTLIREERAQALAQSTPKAHRSEIIAVLTTPSPLPRRAPGELRTSPQSGHSATTTTTTTTVAPISKATTHAAANLPSTTGAAGAAAVSTEQGYGGSGDGRLHAESLHDNIDPALLSDEELAKIRVLPAEISNLEEALLRTENVDDTPGPNAEEEAPLLCSLSEKDLEAAVEADATDEDLQTCTQMMLGHLDDRHTREDDSADHEPHPPALPSPPPPAASAAAVWIDTYAQYNQVSSERFATLWAKHCANGSHHLSDEEFATLFAGACTMGNSRSRPTPFEYACKKTPGCPFSSVLLGVVENHEPTCSPQRLRQLQAAVAQLQAGDGQTYCPHDGCDYSTLSPQGQGVIDQHIKSVHEFQAKACEEAGCDPTKIFTKLSDYKAHQSRYHSDRWPVSCPFPACESQVQYRDLTGLKIHLRTHGLSTAAEMQPFYPARNAVKEFVPQRCFHQGCTSTTEWKRKCNLNKHLRDQHGIAADAVNALVDSQATFIVIRRESSVMKSTGVTVKQATKALNSGDGVTGAISDDDDNDNTGVAPSPKKKKKKETAKKRKSGATSISTPADGDDDAAAPPPKKKTTRKRKSATTPTPTPAGEDGSASDAGTAPPAKKKRKSASVPTPAPAGG